MLERSLSCKTTGFTIKFSLDIINKYAYILDINWDYTYPKPLLLLLKDLEKYLIDRSYTHVIQQVYKQDYYNLLKDNTTWIIYQEQEQDILLIICDTQDLSVNISIGLGLLDDTNSNLT
jgi:hypothetical protein